MSIIRSVTDSALMQANEVKFQISEIAYALPHNEQFQVRKRMLELINNLDGQIIDAFALSNKIDRVRKFVNIVGKLMECKDYLEYVQKSSNIIIGNTFSKIDELSNLLLINSGTLN